MNAQRAGNIEWIKVFLLTASFFCIVSAYTVLREMRDVLFVKTVGCEYVQYVQILSMLILIPAVLGYATLVDRLKKHQVLYFYTILYAIGCVAIGICALHPSIGLSNTHASAYRLFGWAQYLFIEGYAPFVIGLFLAFVNSITLPEETSVSYSNIIAGSKLGGMIVALSSWWFLETFTGSETYPLSILFFIAAVLLFIVPILLRILMKAVPESHLHGYKASYELDQKKSSSSGPWYESIISGLVLMFRSPYALGICGLVFFWEMMSVVLNYNRLGLCVGLSQTTCGLSSMLFLQMFWIHFAGFFIALIGTRLLFSLVGERWSLVVVPAVTCGLVVGYFMSSVSQTMIICYILARAVNYSLAISVREVLYIPTTKEMRFKTKSWIDAFGTKCARGTGSFYSLIVENIYGKGESHYLTFCLSIACMWILVAYRLGRRFETAVKNDEVIG